VHVRCVNAGKRSVLIQTQEKCMQSEQEGRTARTKTDNLQPTRDDERVKYFTGGMRSPAILDGNDLSRSRLQSTCNPKASVRSSPIIRPDSVLGTSFAHASAAAGEFRQLPCILLQPRHQNNFPTLSEQGWQRSSAVVCPAGTSSDRMHDGTSFL
jgi:hypothetical protein